MPWHGVQVDSPRAARVGGARLGAVAHGVRLGVQRGRRGRPVLLRQFGRRQALRARRGQGRGGVALVRRQADRARALSTARPGLPPQRRRLALLLGRRQRLVRTSRGAEAPSSAEQSSHRPGRLLWWPMATTELESRSPKSRGSIGLRQIDLFVVPIPGDELHVVTTAHVGSVAKPRGHFVNRAPCLHEHRRERVRRNAFQRARCAGMSGQRRPALPSSVVVCCCQRASPAFVTVS